MDTWNPAQYEKFRREREQPFFDLMAMIRPSPEMRVVDLDLMRDPIPPERYDLVFSMMTLHHVPDVARGLAAFHTLLNRGGYLCIADLDAEDGSFHGPEVDVHHGFERSTLGKALSAAGFVDVAIGDCFIVEHGPRTYPVFLATCLKL